MGMGQHFKGCLPNGFRNPTRCIGGWEGKFVVNFPKEIVRIKATAGPREIGVRQFRTPIVFEVAEDLSSSDLEDVNGERKQGNTILRRDLEVKVITFINIGAVFKERK